MTAKKTTKKKVSKQQVMTLYMESLLTEEKMPHSIFKFCKEHHISETEFYSFFSSFEHLQQHIWLSFHEHTMALLHKDPGFESYTNKEKMLTFLYTFFEMLTANRSYVLFVLPQNMKELEKLSPLKEMRKHVKEFAQTLVKDDNDTATSKLLKKPSKIFAEGAWLQVLFLMNYWRKDTSVSFEKTDIAIEKSVRAIFDVFDTTPLESILDFGKFLWKEQNN
jgi:hypothetical protein